MRVCCDVLINVARWPFAQALRICTRSIALYCLDADVHCSITGADHDGRAGICTRPFLIFEHESDVSRCGGMIVLVGARFDGLRWHVPIRLPA